MAPDVYLHSGPIHKSLPFFFPNGWIIEQSKAKKLFFEKQEREIQKNKFNKLFRKKKSDDDEIKDLNRLKENLMSDEVE